MTINQTIAINLLNLVESKAQDIESEASSLGATLDLCIKQYEGLSV